MTIRPFCPSPLYGWTDEACPNGPVSFELFDIPLGGGPGIGIPGPPPPRYSIQPCDAVTWDFGDGTTQNVTGQATVTHVYATPGNYTIRATVSNSLGDVSAVAASAPVATSPSLVSFVTQGNVNLGELGYYNWLCTNCIIADERDRTVTVEVERSLDVSQTVSVLASLADSPWKMWVSPFSQRLTFLPGETRKQIVVLITDDDIFSGAHSYSLFLTEPTGGTLIPRGYAQGQLLITDNEPRPTLSAEETHLVVREGNDGLTEVDIPLRLSAPAAFDADAIAWCREDSARLTEDFLCTLRLSTDYPDRNKLLSVPAGSTSMRFPSSWIKGDRRPEPDEQFRVTLEQSSYPDPIVGTHEILITILNDDAAFIPERLAVDAGKGATLKLDIGSPYNAPTMVTFTSSNEKAIAAPKPVTIPAGVTEVSIPITAVSAGNVILHAVAPDRTTQPAVIQVTTPPKQRSARH